MNVLPHPFSCLRILRESTTARQGTPSSQIAKYDELVSLARFWQYALTFSGQRSSPGRMVESYGFKGSLFLALVFILYKIAL